MSKLIQFSEIKWHESHTYHINHPRLTLYSCYVQLLSPSIYVIISYMLYMSYVSMLYCNQFIWKDKLVLSYPPWALCPGVARRRGGEGEGEVVGCRRWLKCILPQANYKHFTREPSRKIIQLISAGNFCFCLYYSFIIFFIWMWCI